MNFVQLSKYAAIFILSLYLTQKIAVIQNNDELSRGLNGFGRDGRIRRTDFYKSSYHLRVTTKTMLNVSSETGG